MRLALLNDEDPVRVLAAQAQRVLAENGSAAEVRSLALLASALTGGPLVEPRGTGPLPTSTPTQATLEATAEETLAATEEVAQAVLGPSPGLHAHRHHYTAPNLHSPRPEPPPRSKWRQILSARWAGRNCGRQPAAEYTGGTGAGHRRPTPGGCAEFAVMWNGEQSVFYTGFAPEMGTGYADFSMTPGVEYSVRVGEAGEKAEGLSMPACGGGWLVEFQEGVRARR